MHLDSLARASPVKIWIIGGLSCALHLSLLLLSPLRGPAVEERSPLVLRFAVRSQAHSAEVPPQIQRPEPRTHRRSFSSDLKTVPIDSKLPSLPSETPPGGVEEATGAPAPLVRESEGTASASFAEALRQRIAAQRIYPLQAQRRGLEGTVTIRFSLGPEGDLLHFDIDGGDTAPILVQAARRAFSAAQPFPRPGAGVDLAINLVFKLEPSTGQAMPPPIHQFSLSEESP